MLKLTRNLLLGATLTLTSGAFLAPASAAGMNAESAIAAAKDARKQAAAVHGEWRDTGKMIKKAEALLKKGKTEEAAKMAQAAEIQGMLGYMQATSQNSDNLHI
jgi:hypothetical protein